ncbi:MAG: hypothetical protein OQL06_13505 [Gammaproteobacteria bacterium]|nr:hypothetical protein [Gammaproteobacteria bacterium]
MEGISDIKIIGIDERRPPVIRKVPYIDLFFQLTHKAPEDWCYDFNSMMSKFPGTPKINEKDGLYIESWVKAPDDIVDYLEQLKIKVAQCSEEYIQRIELATRKAQDANASLKEEPGEQGRLNRIIASLNFDEVKLQ